MERHSDTLTPALAARYAATFDRAVRDGAPQGIHWCLNTPEAETAALGADGHPAGGGGAMPHHAAFPRRMWASSALTFHAPIRVGARVERTSRIESSTEKSGSSGRLLFVIVAHDVTADGQAAVSERQTIVYREAAMPGAAPVAIVEPQTEKDWDWERVVMPSAPLLFRYSALTFNSHRIHYDLPYAREAEGYAGLVVHGPLMAALLLDLADRMAGPDALREFSFRAVAPAFADAPLRLLGMIAGDTVALHVRSAEGHDHMTAIGRLGG